MNGFHVGDFGGADDRGNVEIAARTLSRTDANRLVSKAHMQAMTIGLGINGDGPNSQILASADDANGDLASIGDQDFLEHISAGGWRIEPLRIQPGGRFP